MVRGTATGASPTAAGPAARNTPGPGSRPPSGPAPPPPPRNLGTRPARPSSRSAPRPRRRGHPPPAPGSRPVPATPRRTRYRRHPSGASPLLAALVSRKDGEAPDLVGGPSDESLRAHAPHFIAKSQISE